MISRLRRQELAAGLALIAILGAVYWPVAKFPFINYDDNIYVYENPQVLGGLTFANVRWAFDGFHANFWHPLVWLSLMLDCTIFGPGPAGFHAVNAALHTANAIILWAALGTMTGDRWRSLAVSALWAVHPLRVESVAWITERKDTLSGFFCMLTLLAYAFYAARPTWPRYGFTLSMLSLGLISKPILVTLPAVLLVLDAWPLRRLRTRADFWPLALEKAPFFFLAALGALVAFTAQNAGGALPQFDEIPAGLRVATAVNAIARYLCATFWPANLAVFYPYQKHPAFWATCGAGLALVALTAFAVRSRRQKPYLLAGWLWFLVCLLPVSGLVQVGGFAAADRFTYLPSIGLVIGATWLLADAVPRAGFILAVAGLALAIVSARQVDFWRGTDVLFGRALSATRDNWLAHYNVGEAALSAGNLGEAQAQFTEAARIAPSFARAHDALAYTARAEGDVETALTESLAASRFDLANAKFRYNLGAILLLANRPDASALAFACARRLDPAVIAAHEG